MTLPLPITVAASGFEGLVWLVVIFIWFIAQGLSKAAKKNLPPADDEAPTPHELPPRPAQAPRDELREMIEALTGQKPPLHEPDNEAEEALAPRHPAPRPALRPVPARKPPTPPARFSQPERKLARPVQSAVSTSAPRAAKPPPMPDSAPVPAACPPPVFAPVALAHEGLHLAPLMKMTWPRSQFQRFAMAARRTAAPSPLKRHLAGRTALRQAMVSRIVLGPPGGR